MPKAQITIEDAPNGELSVEADFSPAIDLKSDEPGSLAQAIGMKLIEIAGEIIKHLKESGKEG